MLKTKTLVKKMVIDESADEENDENEEENELLIASFKMTKKSR